MPCLSLIESSRPEWLLLLKEPADRIVAKDGIYYRNRVYWHATLPDLVGKHVEVRAAPIYRAPDEIEVFLEHQWMCTARATDVQNITQKDIGTAKHEQKEHLRRSIKKAREAAHLADQEIAALQHEQSTQPMPSLDGAAPSVQVPASNVSAPPDASPSKPKRQQKAPVSAPAPQLRGDFLERMAAREAAQRKSGNA